jgi:hypothetical protein
MEGMCHSRLLKHVLGIISFRVTLIVFKRDAPLGDIERKITKCAIVIFLAFVRLAEEGIGQHFDSFADCDGLTFEITAAPDGVEDFDSVVGQLDSLIAGLGLNVLDLAAIAITIEVDVDGCYTGGGKTIEQDGFICR